MNSSHPHLQLNWSFPTVAVGSATRKATTPATPSASSLGGAQEQGCNGALFTFQVRLIKTFTSVPTQAK